MTKVFIGGSRRVTRLNATVRERLDRIIEKDLPVIIGDANGADKAVQQYLKSRSYENVEVFCMDGFCRNNIGHWAMRIISAPKSKKGFEYYSIKDEEMAREASVGFMLWDGKSIGTLANIFRLIEQQKKVVVYIAPRKRFTTLKDESDWRGLLCHCDQEVRNRIEGYIRERHPRSRGADRVFLRSTH